ncbi:MAG: pseudouridine synthase [Firmicutes bacterium ML8_F2]|jgi:23S rRNA pseudouridine2605 synthase|nr:MAG: pseudouridine synthase [Firmicutes bacterium ML8_F2]
MRLAKYLADAGIASRRRAEDIIRQKRVKVNGLTAELPQAEVEESDHVTVDGKKVGGSEKKVYFLLNKPPGYISTAVDTHDRPTVIDLLKKVKERVYPVGRLDADTSGALILTNDGKLAYRLTHPRYGIKKTYRAWVKGIPGKKILDKMAKGLLIENWKTAPAEIKLIDRDKKRNLAMLQIVLTEGRKRQVKKMCSAAGYPVIQLQRINFAGLTVDELAVGSYRVLKADEKRRLYDMVGLKQ